MHMYVQSNPQQAQNGTNGGGTRPPAKGAEGDSGGDWDGGGGGGGDGDDGRPPPVLKGLTTDVRREDAFFELFW